MTWKELNEIATQIAADAGKHEYYPRCWVKEAVDVPGGGYYWKKVVTLELPRYVRDQQGRSQ